MWLDSQYKVLGTELTVLVNDSVGMRNEGEKKGMWLEFKENDKASMKDEAKKKHKNQFMRNMYVLLESKYWYYKQESIEGF